MQIIKHCVLYQSIYLRYGVLKGVGLTVLMDDVVLLLSCL